MRRNQLGLKASNVALSTGVVAIFMYLLILATAQDQVLAQLSRSSEFSNYSSSLIDARKAQDIAGRIETDAEKRQALRERVAGLESKAAEAELAYQREAAGLDSIIRKFDGKGDCRIVAKAVPAAPKQTREQREMQARQSRQVQLASAQLCFILDDSLGEKKHQTYVAILDRAKALSDVVATADAARERETKLGDARQLEVNRLVNDLRTVAPTRKQFAMLDSLENPGGLPINPVNYPPFIIHVLLSFFSGTFGALLITMVFVVYPSKLRERVSAKLYYKRVFLGGLVALTVFIVLTGGASILGTSEASPDDANIMSFTAIGLLAGMFSDTVADWLSVRAKSMFSSDEDDEKAKDDRHDKEPAAAGMS
ncbi:MAG: hypothetical protein QOJ27_1884 [Sphingomonadales bacterium]|nr:hypothetical protein [Sphingomonadales bacterium]